MSTTHTIQAQPPTAARRALLNRRSLLLAYATASYNTVEGVVAVTAGAVASSTALIGFGLDSFIEVSSALVVIWQFRSRIPEARERFALRLIALSFFLLAGYIVFGSALALLFGAEAETSIAGIILAAVSVVVMPLLVWAKRRTGRELGWATRGRRLHPDPAVHLPVRDPAHRSRPQRSVRLVLGRPSSRPGHRRCRGQGRHRSLER